MDKPLFIKKKRSWLVWLIPILLALFLLGGCVYYLFQKGKDLIPVIIKLGSSKDGELVFINPDTEKPKEHIVILVLGLDENRDEKGILHHKGSRSDTIFLLGLDKKAESLGVLSIPRDTWLKVSDKHGYDRVNTAYMNAFWDEYLANGRNYEKAKIAGIKQAEKTVEEFTGVKVDYYVLLKIKAASEMVDAIGGIKVDVEKEMHYDDNWGNLHIHLKKGPQILNGKQAVGYARFRHDEEGDWGRIRRQHQVIEALVKELKDPDQITNIKPIAKVIKENVETDLKLEQLIDLARVYRNFNRSHIIKGVIRGEDETIDGKMVIRPDDTLKERLVTRILGDPSKIKPAQLWVRILNGCGVSGLGGRTADTLRKKGYNVVEVDNAKKPIHKVTVIQDHYINKAGAKKLKKILDVNDAKVIFSKNKSNDISLDYTIILGKDAEEAENRKIEKQLKESKPDSTPNENR